MTEVNPAHINVYQSCHPAAAVPADSAAAVVGAAVEAEAEAVAAEAVGANPRKVTAYSFRSTVRHRDSAGRRRGQ